MEHGHDWRVIAEENEPRTVVPAVAVPCVRGRPLRLVQSREPPAPSVASVAGSSRARSVPRRVLVQATARSLDKVSLKVSGAF